VLTQEEAWIIAEEHAKAKGLPWENMLAFFEPDLMWNDSPRAAWSFIDDGGRMGGNLQIAIDAETGDVLEVCSSADSGRLALGFKLNHYQLAVEQPRVGADIYCGSP